MDNYQAGRWKVVCDICGLEGYSTDMVEDWRGYRVHKNTCNDLRNSQDFVRAKPEKIVVPWTRHTDTEGESITETVIGNLQVSNLTVSFTQLIYYYRATGLLTKAVDLPAANDADFLGVSVVYTIYNSASSTSEIFVNCGAGSEIMLPSGLTSSISIGTSGKYRNIPSQNIWIRES
jgi:hypothetical protein